MTIDCWQLTFNPVIIVLHYHQQVTRAEFLVAIEHPIADALVVDVCPFVGTRDDHRFIHPHPRVAAAQFVNEVVARHQSDVLETGKADLR